MSHPERSPAPPTVPELLIGLSALALGLAAVSAALVGRAGMELPAAVDLACSVLRVWAL